MHFYYLNFNWWSITSDEYKKVNTIKVNHSVCKELKKYSTRKKVLQVTDWVFSWILLKIKFSISEENSITVYKKNWEFFFQFLWFYERKIIVSFLPRDPSLQKLIALLKVSKIIDPILWAQKLKSIEPSCKSILKC